MTPEPLKPCLLCGSDKIILYQKLPEGEWVFDCKSCETRIGAWLSEEEAIKAWNNRVELVKISEWLKKANLEAVLSLKKPEGSS